MTARRQASSLSAKLPEGILRRQLEQVEEEFADDAVYEAVMDESISHTSRLFRALAPEEQGLRDAPVGGSGSSTARC